MNSCPRLKNTQKRENRTMLIKTSRLPVKLLQLRDVGSAFATKKKNLCTGSFEQISHHCKNKSVHHLQHSQRCPCCPWKKKRWSRKYCWYVPSLQKILLSLLKSPLKRVLFFFFSASYIKSLTTDAIVDSRWWDVVWAETQIGAVESATRTGWGAYMGAGAEVSAA